MQIFQMLRSGQNPQNLVMSMLKQSEQNNPMASNLANMIQNHDTAGIEKLARNYMQSQGKDFDTEFTSFKKHLGL